MHSDSSVDSLQEQRALITLSLIPRVGPNRIRMLVAAFGSATAALEASVYALSKVEGIGRRTAQTIARFDDSAYVDAQMEQAEKMNALLLPAWDSGFPSLLRHIFDPPVFLWVRGNLQPCDHQAVAIVGTRRASAYGKRVAYSFANELARLGITIVSGLAYGIDAAAHEGALDAGGRTLAILGTGVDRIYPSSNSTLARRILDQGAWLSEYAFQTEPEASNFPRRNRIISGLSLGTLVAEAHLEGGALLTARLALEQNREVFAIPTALFSNAGAGTNQLIREGEAKLVTSVEDILRELPIPSTSPSEPVRQPVDLNPIEQKLWDALGTAPVQIDALCIKTGLDASTALVYLLNLEFKGLVRQMAGKQFLRS